MPGPFFQFSRRGFLQVGTAGVIGSAIPSGIRAATSNELRPGQAKSVLLILLSGGPSQLETFDMKPQAPVEIRGEFAPISTATPGIQISEHMPLLAAQSQRLAIVRTMSHGEHNHLLATHVALTGRDTPIPRGGSDLDRQQSRNDFPNYAAALDYLRPRNDGIPTGVSLPNYFIEGPLTWPGQYSGFLGVKHDPWQINQDPNSDHFKVDELTLQTGVPRERLLSRRQLLDRIDRDESAAVPGRLRSFADQQEIAFSLLTSGKVTEAFQITNEDPAVRERYGRNKFGQSLLLARRLIDAGVPVVQAAMGIVQTWDTHVDNWGRLKNTLLPQLDQGMSALLDDLSVSGRLDETLVILMGEFGRTPRVSTLPGESIPGRDHWAHTYSCVFSGAGVLGGQVIGRSDDIAAYPISRSWSPADLCTTIFDALGVDRNAEILDPLNRPNRLQNGEVIAPLYTGVGA
ncbi:MAG TPA: DUF1501 domain-containing protein [Planctomycetaceae bacterium]|nr:DUF1501 domain-containing protein [Planctomycetaceae bacterium]